MNFQEKFKLLVDRKMNFVGISFPDREEFIRVGFSMGATDPQIMKAIELNAYLGFIQQIIDDFTIRGLPTDYWEEKRAETKRDLDKILDGGEE